MVQAEDGVLGQRVAGLLDGGDVAGVEDLVAGFHEQVLHPEPVQLADQQVQAVRAGPLLPTRPDRGADGDHVQSV
ncbi:hypothetical protein ACIA8E_36250 [Streptomyces sp. NPDC051664]|uniref:hypothetical protein n=1 Tax=Streptomyces sp. NPDC051664 TaxID=3365668 RepID=UPI0037B73774